MALQIAIEEARRNRATRENREAQKRAELRLEEMIKVSGIADRYRFMDNKGDRNVKAAFTHLYSAATTDRMRELIVAAFVAWEKDEQDEERAVTESVYEAGSFMRDNNPVWVDGAAVPFGSDGAA